MKTHRVIIAGSRYFRDYVKLASEVDYYLRKLQPYDIEIVSGVQRTTTPKSNNRQEHYGADYLGEVYAHAHGLEVIPFPADWYKHGKAAGPIRNEQMAKYATHLIAFPLGESRGTRGMIELAKKHGVKVVVVE